MELIKDQGSKKIELHPAEKIMKEGLKALYPTGVIGSPEISNKELGKEVYDRLIEIYSDFFLNS